MLTLALLAGMFAAVPISPVFATTIIIPDNYHTIQAAINAASPGDTILVRAGTYAENLTLNKSVILSAASYNTGDPTHNTTIINGKSSTPTIRIPAGVSPMPTIRGFVVKNGLDGIKTYSEAIIEYNYFIASTDQIDYSAGSGGINRYNVYFNSQDDAIDLDDMTRPLLIENNRMMYNRDDGIEVRLQDASAPSQPIIITIRNNTIIGCDEDGIQFIDYGQAVDSKRNFIVSGNLIANCRFAGIGLMGNANSVEDYSGANIIETIWVYNNTIYGNDYGISGGDNLIAINNIIANSTSRGVWRVQGPAGASSIVAYTLFYNNGIDADQSTLGGGNRFGQNPLFASAPNPGPDGAWKTVDDDFRGLALQAGSPAIDTGYDPSCPAVDLLGVGRPQGAHCDFGAYEYQAKSVDTTGVFRPSNGALYLKNSNTTGFADVTINYGLPGDKPVTGDWDGNGTATIGVYRNGVFYLRNSNTIGYADIVFAFGSPGDQPIAGDWNGDGMDTIGVYRSSIGTFFLRNSNSVGAPELSFALGNAGDVGIAGDWNGNGIDTTGVFRPSNGALYLKNTNATGFADIQINYGLPGDKPVTGDWNDDGIDTIGIYRNGVFYLRNSNTIGIADLVFALGIPGDMPIAGNWDGLP
jgi:hypothetical protein